MKKVTFIIPELRLHEQLSIMALSASLKHAGHEASLIFFQNDPTNKGKILTALKQEDPDFVAFSFMSCVKEQYIELGKFIKEHMDIPIIIGGPAATFDEQLAEDQNSPFDAACICEGDLAIVDFVNKYITTDDISSIQNFIAYPSNGTENKGNLKNLVEPLDDLPFPDRRIIYEKDDLLKNLKIKMFMSGRGCPYKCTYCFNHKYNRMYKGKGQLIRKKTVDYFLEEIRQTQKGYPMEAIIFEDDIFILDKGWLEEFAGKYPKQIGLPFKCYVRPNLVTKDIARLLKISGCHSVQVAIECGNEYLRNKVLKRNMTDKQILDCCNVLYDEGLKIGLINILGLPTETKENMMETLRLNRACKPSHVSANLFMTLPGVDLTLFAIEQGLLDAQFSTQKSTHHLSEMKYPEEIKAVLYPFKSLFPLMVQHPSVEKVFPLLMKLPKSVLKIIDSSYRLYSNARFHPPVSFSFPNTYRLLRRFINMVS